MLEPPDVEDVLKDVIVALDVLDPLPSSDEGEALKVVTLVLESSSSPSDEEEALTDVTVALDVNVATLLDELRDLVELRDCDELLENPELTVWVEPLDVGVLADWGEPPEFEELEEAVEAVLELT